MNLPAGLEIKKSRIGLGLFAKKIIKKGAVLFHFNGRIGDEASTNAKSLQIADDKFLESTAKFDDYLNHSCNPNCYIDWDTLNLVALCDIKKGEELTSDYCAFTWDEVNLSKDYSFKCKCGSKNCRGEMKGFRYLSSGERRRIRKFLAPFLRKKLCKNKN